MERRVYIVLVVLQIVTQGSVTRSQLLENVNPFVGSGGEGFGIGSTPPGAQVPFGMVRLSPDTATIDDIWLPFNHFGGYYYGDGYIREFSHTHMVGSGVPDYGTIGVMPTSVFPTTDLVSNYGFRSGFSHDSENGTTPGYYTVYLEDSEIRAELTATTHVGVHKYTWTQFSALEFILFDISHTLSDNNQACANASIQIDVKNNLVTGKVLNNGGLSSRFGGSWNYFVAKFNRRMTTFGVWDAQQTILEGEQSADYCGCGGFVGFGSNTGGSADSVEVAVGISFISIEQAMANLNTEFGSANDFESIKSQAQQVWEQTLGRVQISGGSSEQVSTFYTALYHTMLAPTTFSEVGGNYLGFDKQVHVLNSTMKAYYTDMSIWDVHRTEFPWLALFVPDVLTDIVRSLVLMYQQGGDLPRWPMANGYTECMIGQHADIIILDAYVKGLRDFDVNAAYTAMRLGATEPRPHNSRCCLEAWVQQGYIPFDQNTAGASVTLAYSFDDWAVGNLAGALGFTQDQAMFLNRSNNYKNIWNSDEMFFCPKTSDGEWNCPWIYTNVFDERYIEGDAWHWRWFVPHDIDGLISLFGSTDYFVSQLEEFFYRSEDDPYNILPNPYYWAGNEPDILAVWLFDSAGRPDLTQQYSRMVMATKYTNQSDGLPGNDDYGTMSAWFVFSALGIYPQAGTTTYFLGSPIFDEVTINLPTGTLQITAYNNSDTNVFVEKVAVNGVLLQEPFVDHSQLLQQTATIEFWMTDSPTQKFRV